MGKTDKENKYIRKTQCREGKRNGTVVEVGSYCMERMSEPRAEQGGQA